MTEHSNEVAATPIVPNREPVVTALVPFSTLCGPVPLDPLSVAGLEAQTARLVELISHARGEGDQTLIRSLRRELLVVRHELARTRREAAAPRTSPVMGDPSRGV